MTRALSVGFLLTSLIAAAQPKPCAMRGQSITLPVRPHPDYTVMATLGGAQPHTLQIDTGSTGIVVARQHIGRATPATSLGLQPYIVYTSSDKAMVGQWVYTSVELSAGGRSVTIPKLAVLAIDKICRTIGGKVTPPFDCSQPTPAKALADVGMMGVGFDRGSGMGRSSENPFLRLPQMDAGTMQRGYIISATGGVTLGMRATDVAAFRFLPLQPAAASGEWLQARGCIAVRGGGITNPGRPVCGSVLMDTGVDKMFVTYSSGFPTIRPPFPNQEGDVWTCPTPQRPCLIHANAASAGATVTWPSAAAPLFTYAVTAPRQFTASGASPAALHVRAAPLQDGSAVFINTSRQLLETADYLFDATCGRIGFRPKTAGH